MSEKLKFDGVQVVLADPRAQLRGTLKVALAHSGIENIEHTGSIERVVEAVDQGIGPDILICDMGLDDGKACEILSNIRKNEIGRNPFLGVIGVTWSSTAHNINHVMNSGVDYLISAPLSPQQILDRIKALAKERAPFVATSAYVGPERRGKDRRPEDTPLLEVPNTVKAKQSGSWSDAEILRDIEMATGDLITLKIAHQAGQIIKLADLIREHATAQPRDKIETAVNRLSAIVSEMSDAVAKRNYQHISELTSACVGSVEKIKELGVNQAGKDFQLLTELGRAIRIALYPEDTATEIAHDIAKTVGGAR